RRAAGCTPHGCFRPPELRMATAPRRQAARASRVGRRPGRAAGVDPVTTEIVLGAFETICYEMAAHVSLTATTPILNQSNERNATILDATGQLAALSVGEARRERGEAARRRVHDGREQPHPDVPRRPPCAGGRGRARRPAAAGGARAVRDGDGARSGAGDNRPRAPALPRGSRALA